MSDFAPNYTGCFLNRAKDYLKDLYGESMKELYGSSMTERMTDEILNQMMEERGWVTQFYVIGSDSKNADVARMKIETSFAANPGLIDALLWCLP